VRVVSKKLSEHWNKRKHITSIAVVAQLNHWYVQTAEKTVGNFLIQQFVVGAINLVHVSQSNLLIKRLI
jgi:ribosomal protein L30E